MDKFVDEFPQFLEILHLPRRFLGRDLKMWDQDHDYKMARPIGVQIFKVVNDTAERGLPLATTFNDKTKKSEEVKQKLFQTVEENRNRSRMRKRRPS